MADINVNEENQADEQIAQTQQLAEFESIMNRVITRTIENQFAVVRDQLSELKSEIDVIKSRETDNISDTFPAERRRMSKSEKKIASRRETITGMVMSRSESSESEDEIIPRLRRREANVTIIKNPDSNFKARISHLKNPQGVWEILTFLREYYIWSVNPNNAAVKIMACLSKEAVNTLLIKYREYSRQALYDESNKDVLEKIYFTVAPGNKSDFIKVLSKVKFNAVSFSTVELEPWINSYEQYRRDFLDVMDICLKVGDTFMPAVIRQEGGFINIFLNGIEPSQTAWNLYDKEMGAKKFTVYTEFVKEFTEKVHYLQGLGKGASDAQKIIGAPTHRNSAQDHVTPVRQGTFSRVRYGVTPQTDRKREYERQRQVHGLSHVTAEDVDDSTLIAQEILGDTVEGDRKTGSDYEKEAEEDSEDESGMTFYTPDAGFHRLNFAASNQKPYSKPQGNSPAVSAEKYKALPCFNMMKFKECKSLPKCNFNHDHTFIRDRLKEMTRLWFPTDVSNPKPSNNI